MGTDLLPLSIRDSWEVHERRHACAVLSVDYPAEWVDLIAVLSTFRLPKSSVLAKGGGKSPIAQNINGMFSARGWVEKKFEVVIDVDGTPYHTPTHKVDYFKNRIAIETEWNNKDPFYDRDLNNFRLLFDLHAVSVGVIITRASELQGIFDAVGKGKSYGQATTHLGRLIPKIESGSAGGCPLLAFGITKKLYVDDDPTVPGVMIVDAGGAEIAEEDEGDDD